ncbi:Predicted nucleic acid-binding protein, contains PIN domain [Paenibacillaceae bacterium GAS479]|nr:Predicted nucleic acid-binding protein, contains PIN domain [Paenibacillaceae bacterium GAS479]
MCYFFFDSCAVVRAYNEFEQGHLQAKELFFNNDNTIIVCELMHLEFTSAMKKKMYPSNGQQMNQMAIDSLRLIASEIVQKVDDNTLIFILLDSEIYKNAVDLVRNHGLRTLDAIQLQSALTYQGLDITFVSSDNKMCEAAGNYFTVINLNNNK